jgi:uncharacterized membrane protein
MNKKQGATAMTASVAEPRPVILERAASGAPEPPAWRIQSIDFVRGLVMILMAVDHVRVFSGVPAGGPSPAVFFTRWITHFVAPAFVFLAGTAAYLHGRKLASPAALSKFLFIRGAWLVLLELTIIRVAWTFNFDFAHSMLAGVIWVIGWCMILMSLLVRVPVRAVGAIGVVIIAGHNALDPFVPQLADAANTTSFGWLLKLLYLGFSAGPIAVGPGAWPLLVLYSIVPWIGVMAAGYAFGTVMTMEPARRRRICLTLGLSATALFVILRAIDVYGDPRHWREAQMPAVLAFLSTTKYPASLSFLLMTLGPMFLLLALAERWKGRIASIVTTFGRVPLFYYLLHIPLIHAAACVVSLVREGRVNPWLFGNHPMDAPPVPEGYRWSLGLLYLIVLLCVTALYFPCRWYARLRATKRAAWLSYI